MAAVRAPASSEVEDATLALEGGRTLRVLSAGVLIRPPWRSWP